MYQHMWTCRHVLICADMWRHVPTCETTISTSDTNHLKRNLHAGMCQHISTCRHVLICAGMCWHVPTCDINLDTSGTRLMWTIWTSLSAVRERPLYLITHSLDTSDSSHLDLIWMLACVSICGRADMCWYVLTCADICQHVTLTSTPLIVII